MNTLKIAAASTFHLEAGAEPADLRAELKAACERPPRRLNRFIQLALIGAHRCMAGAPVPPGASCDLYLGSGQGNVADTVSLLRDIHADRRAPMPFAFINVSSNMAGFYIAQSLGLQGGNMTVSRQDCSFEACLELASADVRSRPSALIGAVDECAWPLDQHRQRLAVSDNTTLGEGSHWLRIDQSSDAPVAEVDCVRRFNRRSELDEALEAALNAGPVTVAMGPGMARHDDALTPALGEVCDYGREQPYYETLSAYAICRFVETAQAGARLLHVNRDATGTYYGLTVRKF